MNEENINKTSGDLRILVAPLDWGLGHATRCIPIIHALLHMQITVVIAADGAVKQLLQEAFPGVVFLSLKGYRIQYSKNKKNLFFKLASQLPRILSVIRYEKKWLAKAIKDHRLHAVISDNRFGLYNKNVPCIYITHQLFIETGNTWLSRMAQAVHYRFISKFSECWVPDAAGKINLAGKLSHPSKMPPVAVQYLGVLSRFNKEQAEEVHPLLLMLSGPEPQRSIFEKELLAQLAGTKQEAVLVRGLPGAAYPIHPVPAGLVVYDHLPAQELNKLIAASGLVIARAGYSTMMDLATMQKKAVIVPTPGQTEQTYLALHAGEEKIFLSKEQEGFSLKETILEAGQFDFKTIPRYEGDLQTVLRQFIRQLAPGPQ
jgi:UDP:flavonoid glycosyltransferase YjiC (YdhE family)